MSMSIALMIAFFIIGAIEVGVLVGFIFLDIWAFPIVSSWAIAGIVVGEILAMAGITYGSIRGFFSRRW